jgi:aquaporin Z
MNDISVDRLLIAREILEGMRSVPRPRIPRENLIKCFRSGATRGASPVGSEAWDKRVGSLRDALRSHWPEYLIEGGGLGLFMLSALLATALLQHPASPVRAALPDPMLRRLGIGLALGATAMALVYSPFGKRSGAHFNPAMTFTFFRLGKVEGPDALLYACSQFGGAALGVLVGGLLMGPRVADPRVAWAVTRPGAFGATAAFAAEVAISFGLMLVALFSSNSWRTNRFTGLLCGLLIATYYTFEAPISGMSMNPARTLGSATGAGVFDSLWIYFTAPPLGMLLAAELYLRLRGGARVRCAKLHHQNAERCIFRCDWPASAQEARWTAMPSSSSGTGATEGKSRRLQLPNQRDCATGCGASFR